MVEEVSPAVRAAVAERVRALLHGMPGSAAFRADLAAALALLGGILSDAGTARWAEPLCICCVAAGGPWRTAVPAAAAVEIFMAALDVLDDVEDEERTPLIRDLGTARALNASTGLLLLAGRALLAAPGGAEALSILLDGGLVACDGQHADLDPCTIEGITLDGALAVAAAKSASLAAAICRLGTCCADAAPSAQELYARFGWLLGMVEQLANDLAALHPDATGKTDIALGRPTLPRAHAALLTSSPAAADLDVFWTQGPAYLTWAAAEAYRRHALALIPALTNDHGHHAALAALLPRL